MSLFSLLCCNNEPVFSVNENNAGKKVYDLKEATCFIAIELNKKSSDLNLINDALTAEANYMRIVNLVTENLLIGSETESDIINFDLNTLVEYVLNNEKVKLTKNELLEIYDAEIKYLKFIGVVKE